MGTIDVLKSSFDVGQVAEVCLVAWFYYQMIAKPGNKTCPASWPDLYQ